jgi:hypothetical protein
MWTEPDGGVGHQRRSGGSTPAAPCKLSQTGVSDSLAVRTACIHAHVKPLRKRTRERWRKEKKVIAEAAAVIIKYQREVATCVFHRSQEGQGNVKRCAFAVYPAGGHFMSWVERMWTSCFTPPPPPPPCLCCPPLSSRAYWK